MDSATRARLEAVGFRETSVQELFELTPEESEFIEVRLALAELIRDLRRQSHLTHRKAAALLRSDQANVSKAEKNDDTVSLDWMIKAAFALGADRVRVGRAICG